MLEKQALEPLDETDVDAEKSNRQAELMNINPVSAFRSRLRVHTH